MGFVIPNRDVVAFGKPSCSATPPTRRAYSSEMMLSVGFIFFAI
jgi:hypothetical protein